MKLQDVCRSSCSTPVPRPAMRWCTYRGTGDAGLPRLDDRRMPFDQLRSKPKSPTRLTQAGHPPKVLTGAAVVGTGQATELFEAAYDEHARRLAKLYKNLGRTSTGEKA